MFARQAADTPRVLIILGTRGVGKTSLVRSIVVESSAEGRRRIQVFSASDLAFQMAEAVRRGTCESIPHWFRRGDVVAIEELCDLRRRPATLEAIGRMIARWTVAGACVVGTAACSLQEITAFERRLPKPPTSHVVMLATPTRREMRLVVKSLANTNNLRIDARTVADIAAWCDGDIRRAVGAIRQLQFEARLRP